MQKKYLLKKMRDREKMQDNKGNKGDKYESEIHKILLKKNLTNTQRGGGSDKPDVVVNLSNNRNINIECKTPGADYGQKALFYSDSKWKWSIPDTVTRMYDFLKVLDYIDQGFIPKNANHSNLSAKDWGKLKKKIIGSKEKEFDQKNFEKSIENISLDHFYEFYKSRDTYYLQLKGSGFYHLSEDKYKLGTEQYDGRIKLRLRAKSIHAHEYWVNGKKVKSKGMFDQIKEEESKNPPLFPSAYEITEKPWHYGFYAVIKEVEKPTKSEYSIEPDMEQSFPRFY